MNAPTNHPGLDALRRLPRRERIAALRSAMRVASRQERERIAIDLIELGIAEHRHRPAPRRGLSALAFGPRERSKDDAILSIVSHWEDLSEPTRRAALAAGAGRWDAIADSMLQSDDPGDLKNLAALVLDAPDPGFARAMFRLLAHEDAGVALAGDRAFVRLAMCALDDPDPDQYGRELAQLAARPRLDINTGRLCAHGGAPALLTAVADAAWAFAEHRCTGALLAALLLLDQPLEYNGGEEAQAVSAAMLRLHRLIDEASHPSHAPLAVALKRRGTPVLRARAWRLLTSPGLGAAAVERVARADNVVEHEGLLADAHLSLNPKRRRRLGLVDVRTRRDGAAIALDVGSPLPNEDLTRRLSDRARRGLPLLTANMRVDAALGRLVRTPLLDDADALVRLNAARFAEPVELADYLFDPDPRVARTAVFRWSTAGDPDGVRWPPRLREAGRARLAGRLERRPERDIARCGLQEWDRLSPFDPRSPVGRLGARRWLAEEPKSFLAQLTDRLESAEVNTRLDALQLVRALRIGARLEKQVIEHALNAEEDARVRATSVALLGELTSDASREALDRATSSTDQRVRANAVEARGRRASDVADLATAEPETHAAMIELKHDPHHRVRANALRALLRSGTPRRTRVFEPAAIEELEAMLCDERDMHRIAGVWLAERVLSGSGRARLGGRWDDLARRVASIATGDPSERARARASRCAARLLGELRADPGVELVSGGSSEDAA